MPEQSPSKRWKRGWQPKGAWVFETRDDGTILFFPHAWGRGYVVPTKEKRREIEAYLRLWRIRIRAILRFLEPLFLICCVVFLVSIFCGFFLYPGWNEFFWGSVVAALAVDALALGSYATLPFLAETSKADLEKSDVRRSFVDMQRYRARRLKWWEPWFRVACSGVVVLAGVWLLQPRSETVMQPPHVIRAFLPTGVSLVVLGAVMGLFGFWQMAVKRKSERTGPG